MPKELLDGGRAWRRRRVGVVASLAALLVVVLAGLSFPWAGKAERAMEPAPATWISS